jgi:hypothetical protein
VVQPLSRWAVTPGPEDTVAGSLVASQRAAAIISLIQSAKLNGLDPWRT